MSRAATTSWSDSFIGYAPIVARDRNAIATRLSFLSNGGKALSASQICAGLGAIWPATATPVLLDLGDEVLDESLLEVPASEQIWLEVPGRLAGEASGLELIAALHAHGYGLVLRGRPARELPKALLPAFRLALVHVDEDRRLRATAEPVEPVSHRRAIPYAQAGVESVALMTRCFDVGAQAVIGWPFRDAIEHADAAASSPDFMVIARLLQMIDSGADPDEMEGEIRQDPALAFRLLRYINSPAFGLRVEVQSFRHALMMLGIKKLRKWLALMLATSSKNANLRPVMFASFRRGLFLEHLVAEVDVQERDEMFILGVFSLLDKMFSEPFRELLERLNLPERISDSLLGTHGAYTPYLRIAEAVEQGPHPRLERLLDTALISLERCNNALVQALMGPEAEPSA